MVQWKPQLPKPLSAIQRYGLAVLSVGAVSENSITRQQAVLVRRAKTSCRNPAISLGLALVANSLDPGQEKRTMRELEGQIGNSS